MLLQQGTSSDRAMTTTPSLPGSPSLRGSPSLSGSSSSNSPRPRSRTVLSSPDPRLCPRVMVDVDIPQGRNLSSAHLDTAKVVHSYLRSRSPNMTPVDPAMFATPQKTLKDLILSNPYNKSENVSERGVPLYENQRVGVALDYNGCVEEGQPNHNGGHNSNGYNTSSREKQLTAYMAWVNSQLKKKPGAHLVEDLRHDVRDGVALVDLIEVISGEKLTEVHAAPSTYTEMTENVEQVLQYMSAKKIKMHHITTRDVVEGNLKAIMRLILALAAHYKPNSVRHSSQSNKQNIAGIAQGAAAALTEARRNATRAGHRYRRRRQKEESKESQYSDSDQSQSYPTTSSSHKKSSSMSRLQQSSSHRHRHQHYHHLSNHPSDQRMLGEGESSAKTGIADSRAELEGASASSSPVSSHNTSPRASLYLSDPPSSMEGLLSVSGGANRGSLMVTSCESDNAMGDSGYNEICDSLKDTHQMLFQLHELLLNGENTDGSRNSPNGEVEGTNPRETIIILKGRLLQAEEVAESLKADLTRAKKECLELQGTKAGQQQRLTDQDGYLSSIKSDVMRLELEKEKLVLEMDTLKKQLSDREQVLSDVKTSFVKQIEDKDKVMGDLRRELLKRDQIISQLQEQVSQLKEEGAVKNAHVKDQMMGLAADIKKIDRAGAQLEAKVSSQDHRMSLIADYMTKAADSNGPNSAKYSELENIRENLMLARSQMSSQDPCNSTLDCLEESIIKLLDRVHINGSRTPPSQFSPETTVSTTMGRTANTSQNRRLSNTRDGPKVSSRGRAQSSSGRGSPGRGSPARGSPARRGQGGHQGPTRGQQVSPRASTATHAINRGTPSKVGRSHIPVPHGQRTKTPSPTIIDNQTVVMYYREQSDKPCTCVIRKKLGDIKLRDFKAVIVDSNLYHYFFKALDPEYGTVKEELCNDDDILPGWEGKIVAWLEEESGTVC